jgi:branched-chain amino acid transport system substrate-binding protein
MRSRIFQASAVMACLALGLAACSSSSKSSSPTTTRTSGPGTGSGTSAPTGTPFVVLLEAGLSSTGSTLATVHLLTVATNAAASVLNSQGGINGHPVKVDIVSDGGSDPTTAVEVLNNYLASHAAPNLVMNTGPSNVSAAVLPIVASHHLLMMNNGDTSNSGDATKFPTNFDMQPTQAAYASSFTAYAKQKGYSSVAILWAQDTFTQPEESFLVSDLNAAGIKITGNEAVSPEALNVTPQLAQLKSGNPDALFYMAFGSIAGYVVQDASQLNWNLPIAGDIAASDSPVLSTPPAAGMLGTPAENNLVFQVLQASVKGSASQTAATATMLNAFQQAGGANGSVSDATNYDGLMMAAAAAKIAGTITNVNALVSAIQGLQPGQAATGVYPYYQYSATSHTPIVPADSYIFIKPAPIVDGLFVPAA